MGFSVCTHRKNSYFPSTSPTFARKVCLSSMLGSLPVNITLWGMFSLQVADTWYVLCIHTICTIKLHKCKDFLLTFLYSWQGKRCIIFSVRLWFQVPCATSVVLALELRLKSGHGKKGQVIFITSYHIVLLVTCFMYIHTCILSCMMKLNLTKTIKKVADGAPLSPQQQVIHATTLGSDSMDGQC